VAIKILPERALGIDQERRHDVQATPPQLIVVQDFDEELKRLMPMN